MWLSETLLWVGMLVLVWSEGKNAAENIVQSTKIDTYHLIYNPDTKWGFAQQIDHANEKVKEWVCKQIGDKDDIRHIYVQADYDLEKEKISDTMDIFEISSRHLQLILAADECKN